MSYYASILLDSVLVAKSLFRVTDLYPVKRIAVPAAGDTTTRRLGRHNGGVGSVTEEFNIEYVD